MFLTGFADEAADDVDGQIAATKTLGWKHIESRRAGSANIHDIPDAEFDAVCAKLAPSGVQINCFGSAIANWSKRIDQPADSSLAEARRAIPRMTRLGCKMIRIMSFAVLPDRPPADQMEDERFRRLRELRSMFADAGIIAVHENCMNYGGMAWSYTLRLLDHVPGLKLVFDTGNPVFSADRAQPAPHPRQSAWDFYRHVREHVVYVHIKDGIWHEPAGKIEYTFPGEGHGDVARIVKDLLDSGYDGGFSMEPHMTIVHHEAEGQSPQSARLANYVEYGRRFMRLVAAQGHGDKLA